MKYYNLHIDFEPSSETYKEITAILSVTPTEDENSKPNPNELPSDWHYQLVEHDNEKPIDFINVFLDILEPKLEKLAKLGINKSNILFWLFYVTGSGLRCCVLH